MVWNILKVYLRSGSGSPSWKGNKSKINENEIKIWKKFKKNQNGKFATCKKIFSKKIFLLIIFPTQAFFLKKKQKKQK